MPDEEQIRVRVTARYMDNYMLASIAHHQLAMARQEKDGYRFRWLIPCMAISVFRLESLCNQYGVQLFDRWDQMTNNMSFRSKITKISEHLGLQPNYQREPWASIARMIKFRNLLAHSKMVEVSEELTVRSIEQALILSYPEPREGSVFRDYSSLQNAERFHEIVSRLDSRWAYQARLNRQDIDRVGGRRLERVVHDEQGNPRYEPIE